MRDEWMIMNSWWGVSNHIQPKNLVQRLRESLKILQRILVLTCEFSSADGFIPFAYYYN